ncbi:hypothetical protein Geu3261_0238_002 [Komagataeibacter europaeus NBRC 3261]|uniref:Uncharacterized protein n=1 Tax=Komagataeibacter europaeus NBRC 3261 TaxID=1234669 RepID=A0A0D6Q440_KOMEU|nr:hypothetical protein Geu3261_0238_002 [Komagataeibacter europaeus NBRC 3261]
MRGPELVRLVRSLRTKSYEKLQIQKHMVALGKRAAGQDRELQSQENALSRDEPHRQIESD